VRHGTLFDKLASLPMPDNIYAWLIDLINQHRHLTKFGQTISERAHINATVVQGSTLGPILFNVNFSHLKAKVPSNIYVKYVDDCYLVVPAANSSSIQDEMTGIEQWCAVNIQQINTKKSFELIVRPSRARHCIEPPLTAGVERVSSINVLGVRISIDHNNEQSNRVNNHNSITSVYYAML